MTEAPHHPAGPAHRGDYHPALLLHDIARQTSRGNQTTLTSTSLHAHAPTVRRAPETVVCFCNGLDKPGATNRTLFIVRLSLFRVLKKQLLFVLFLGKL